MLIGREELDLRLTLVDSAQCFHWRRVDDRYGAVVDGMPVWLWYGGEGVLAEGEADVPALRHYLDLDRDYAAVAAEYAHIPAARRAVGLFPGLRVLNQPAWEALVAFILSANNNVARIRNLVRALCERYGAAWDTPTGTLYAFPTPERLASCGEEELRALKLGYRAPFLIRSARLAADGFPLDALPGMPYDEARRLLMTLPGVGGKVADCVLLFGCGHSEAFPVDVWVCRLLRDWFGLECADRDALASQARALLGDHGGLMQQFLFHAARVGAIGLDGETR